MGYDRSLRAIGQALETLNIQNFEMEPAGDDFYIKGSVPFTAKDGILGSRYNSREELRSVWGALPGGEDQPWSGKESNLSSFSRLDLCYTVQDVQRLEQEGRARRGSSQDSADASSLSQVLRSIGAYLNQKRARLCKISRESDSLAIEFITSMGSIIKETLTLKDLYDLWVRMYLQRSERSLGFEDGARSRGSA